MDNAVVLLFAVGERPSAREIQQFSQSHGQFAVTLECTDPSEPDQWAELLANGLTFDMSGLAPGRACRLPPQLDQQFGFDGTFDLSACEGVTLAPGSGGPMIPVLRCLAWLTAELAEIGQIKAIAWPPAGSVCEPAYFRDSVTRWLGGGAFPGFGLTSLITQPDGSLRSRGLALFTGQELLLDADLAQDRTQGAKVALRLLHWLVESGKIEETMSLTGPTGDTLVLEPHEDGGIVSVWRGSR